MAETLLHKINCYRDDLIKVKNFVMKLFSSNTFTHLLLKIQIYRLEMN